MSLRRIPGTEGSPWTKPLAFVAISGLLSFGWVAGSSDDAFAESWDQIVNVSETGTNGGDTSLALGPNGSLNLAWIQQNSDGDDRFVMFSRSVNRGATWSSPATLAGDNGADVGAPQLVVDAAGQMTAIWELEDYDKDEGLGVYAIQWARSSDNGLSWSTAQQASANAVDSTQAHMSLTADGGLVALWSEGIWDSDEDEYTGWKVMSAYKSFADNSWTTSEEMTSDSDAPTPKIIREANGTLTAMWDAEKDGSDTTRRIYVASSTDDGETWETPVALSHDSGGLDTREGDIVATGDGGVTVVWSRQEPESGWPDPTPKYKVEASYRSPEGAWQEPSGTSPGVIVLSDPTVNSGRGPRLAAVGENQVIALWEFDTEIQSKSSGDSGASWSDDAVNLNAGAGSSLPNSQMMLTNSSEETLAVWGSEDEENLWSASSSDAGSSWTVRQEVAPLGYRPSGRAVDALLSDNDGSFYISFKQTVASDSLVSVAGYLTAQSGSGDGDSGRNDDNDDGDTVAAVVTPAPSAAATARSRVADATSRQPVTGPVLRGGVVSAPPRVSTVSVGGVPTIVEESSPDPTTLSVVAGSLSLGVSVDEGSGEVSRADDGSNRLSVTAGTIAALRGSGLQPGARVQVFIPLGVDDSRELANVTVAADGTFSGEMPVSTDPLAEPLPIGERLLQLVSVDADGNQVVFEMAVNVTQADPAPALDREAGEIPVVGLGASAVTSAGVVTAATMTAMADQGLAVVEGDTWNMTIAIDSEQGGVESTESGALVTLVRDEAAQVSGVGFMAGTRADVWLFSEPVLLGTVTIDENGEFSGEVGIDPDLIPTGEHTLQLQGVGQDGYVKAATMGVSVNDAQPELAAAEQAGLDLGFIWWILAIIVLVAIVVALWLRRNRRA